MTSARCTKRINCGSVKHAQIVCHKRRVAKHVPSLNIDTFPVLNQVSLGHTLTLQLAYFVNKSDQNNSICYDLLLSH